MKNNIVFLSRKLINRATDWCIANIEPKKIFIREGITEKWWFGQIIYKRTDASKTFRAIHFKNSEDLTLFLLNFG